MKLFYLDIWSDAMYEGASYGDVLSTNAFDLVDGWGGMTGEWAWIMRIGWLLGE